MTNPSVAFLHPPHKHLCPSCGGKLLQIHTSASISYEVVFDDETNELLVVGESIGDSDWDQLSTVECPTCHWNGQLGDCVPPA